MAYSNVNASASKLMQKNQCPEAISDSNKRRTEATALSRDVEAPPPRLIVAIEGRPDERAEVRTKFKPDTLFPELA